MTLTATQTKMTTKPRLDLQLAVAKAEPVDDAISIKKYFRFEQLRELPQVMQLTSPAFHDHQYRSVRDAWEHGFNENFWRWGLVFNQGNDMNVSADRVKARLRFISSGLLRKILGIASKPLGIASKPWKYFFEIRLSRCR